MPMPTIPGIPPETWEQLLEILASLNTDIVELGEQGITTFEQLKQWLTMQGYELVEISEVVGYTVMKTSAVDPTTTNAVANRVATDIVATGGAGTAVTQFVSGGNRTIGLVPKVVAVGACLSMLVSLIGAGLVSDENKNDLVTSVDPYTIDGENVPVLIDENGKTHFLDEMVEAVRAKAIELGIFDNNTPSDASDIPAGSYFNPSTQLTGDDPATVVSFLKRYFNDGIDRVPSDYYTDILKRDRVLVNNAIDDMLSYLKTSFPQAKVGFYKARYYAANGTYDATFILSPFPNYNYIVYGSGDARYFNFGYEGVQYGGCISLTVSPNTNPNDSSVIHVYGGGVNGTNRQIGLTLTRNTTTPPSGSVYLSSKYAIDNSTYTGSFGFYHECTVRSGFSSTSVEGITPAQDLISAGVADATKPLTEVLPQLAQGQMSIASPTENDLTHKSNWYPVSINSEDVFTDGATEEETSTATDGDVKPDLQPAILDAINELIKQLNPDGTPDIPVSDSGDTPPENPPLTPSSGANGSNGLWAIYNPTLTQVQEFGAWLWSDSLADQFKRIFNSPIDGVIGFHMLYCTPSRGADQTIKCGFLASPVSSRTVSSPYVEIDCGTVNIGEFYRNALDYDYTRISVYLPFIGIIPLDTNIVMGSDLNITYRVDVLTGTCLAQIKVIKENSDAVMYAFEGNCAVQIPLTATTYTGMVGALMSGVSAGIGVMTGNIAQAVTSGANALANMVSGKSGVKQSGTMGANAGALGIRKPYVIITHPIAYMPIDFNKLEGLPSNITATLGSLTGFTRVRSVHLENIGSATQEEINMIEELLKEGVII